ncbi:MAG TPA: hypothetical protein VGB62_07180 [Allosphingosinicella sp.]
MDLNQRTAEQREKGAAAMALAEGVDHSAILKDKKAAQALLKKAEALASGGAAEDPLGRNALDYIRVPALIALDRHDEALAVARALVVRAPSVPPFYHYSFPLSARTAPRELASFVDLARQRVRREDLGTVRGMLEVDDAFLALRTLSLAKDEASRARLAQSLLDFAWPLRDDPSAQDSLRKIVLNAKLKAGDAAGARALAQELVTVEALAPMVVASRYSVLLDASAADVRLRRLLDGQDARTRRLVEAAPEDMSPLVERAQFFRMTGRPDEALKLLQPHVADMAKVKQGGQRAFWAVNEAAFALDDLGRSGEGIALMDRLLALGVDEHSDLINMAINRLELFNSAGRYEEGAREAAKLDRQAKGLASDYGFMWIWSSAACAQSAAGKPAAAAPWLEKLAAKSSENPAAHTRALLCANDIEGAGKTIVARLSEDDPSSTLMALQEFEPGPHPGSALQRQLVERLASVKARPEVAAAIGKTGRILRLPFTRSYWGDF